MNRQRKRQTTRGRARGSVGRNVGEQRRRRRSRRRRGRRQRARVPPTNGTKGQREAINRFRTQITQMSERGQQHNSLRECLGRSFIRAAADAARSLYQSTTRLEGCRKSRTITEHAALSFTAHCRTLQSWPWWPLCSNHVPYPGPPILAEFPALHLSPSPATHKYQTHALRIIARPCTRMPSSPRYASYDQESELAGRMIYDRRFSEAWSSCIPTPYQRI